MKNKLYLELFKKRVRRIIFLIVVCFLMANCNHQTSTKAFGSNITQNLKQLKQTKTFLFHISNQIDSIGYKIFEDGEIMSIACIKIVDDFVFLSDPVHCNIKRINLKNGKLTTSDVMDKDSSFLTNIGYFNNTIYVFTFLGNVHLLDKNLESKGSFFLPNYFGYVDIYEENQNYMTIYRNPDDLFQDNEYKDFLIKMLIDKNNNFSFDTIELQGGESLSRLRKEVGKETIQGDKLIFETPEGKYEIPYSIDIKKDYDCKRIDYSDKYLVSFEVSKEVFKLTVFEY